MKRWKSFTKLLFVRNDIIAIVTFSFLAKIIISDGKKSFLCSRRYLMEIILKIARRIQFENFNFSEEFSCFFFVGNLHLFTKSKCSLNVRKYVSPFLMLHAVHHEWIKKQKHKKTDKLFTKQRNIFHLYERKWSRKRM